MKKTIIGKLLEEYTELNEMSLAWDYDGKKIKVCAWVENPMPTDNRYFKYYNAITPNKASKVARIRIDKPAYVGGDHKESNSQGKVEKWLLTESDIDNLITLLKSESDDNASCTKWQDIIIRWNRDNFGIPPIKTINGDIEGYQSRINSIKDIKPFPIDYSIPDYTRLL